MTGRPDLQWENADGAEVIGRGAGFERIRRITGYLVGTLDRFNNAKRAEVNDRVKHAGRQCGCYDREAV